MCGSRLAQRPPVLDLRARLPQRAHGVVHPVQIAVPERRGLHVEAHRDVRGPAVGRQRSHVGLRRAGGRARGGQRVLRGQDVRELFQGGDRRGHLRAEGGQFPLVVVEDDLAAVAAGLRVVSLEDLDALLRLRVGEREVVRVVAADGPADDLEHHEGDQPGDDHHHEVASAPLAHPAQHPRPGPGARLVACRRHRRALLRPAGRIPAPAAHRRAGRSPRHPRAAARGSGLTCPAGRCVRPHDPGPRTPRSATPFVCDT
ncbi:hypothetical protein SUDANB66_05879 [Streptomyces sp. SudanB66_2053]